MAGVVELIDRAVSLPPGAELSAVLDAIPRERVPNARLIEVAQARYRQLSRLQAEVFADLVEISHTVAVDDLTSDREVVRAGERFEWAAHEIAAGLGLTPTAAERELGFATALCERLPQVQAALHHGDIDRGKARVFVDYLDPADGDVTEEQAQRLCEKFVPPAPKLTTKQLADRLYRALLAIDPGFRRRRYERAVQARGVALYLDPRTGTATVVGEGLPADEAAAAVARLDRLTEATKRAGHPGTRRQISADLFLGMLNGAFHGLTEDEIIARLLAKRRPEDTADPDRAGTDNAGTDSDADTAGTDSGIAPIENTEPAGDPRGPIRGITESAGEVADRWAGDRVATREGIEIRIGLGTLAGARRAARGDPRARPDQRPHGAHRGGWAAARSTLAVRDRRHRRPPAARRAAAPPTRHRNAGATGARWQGRAAPHPRRTRPPHHRPDAERLARAARRDHPRWADRDQLRRRLAATPGARFARGPLADHVRIRDRNCVGPGCTRPAHRSDLDHTRDHARGGDTVEGNVGPACKRHHPDKDRGWSLTQPEPGLFRWGSPLGRTYLTKGEPVRPDLPRPQPAHHEGEETAAEVDQRLRRYDRPILQRPATDPPRPPPPPEPAPIVVPPPF